MKAVVETLALCLTLGFAPNGARAALDEPHGAVESCTVHYVQEPNNDCEMCETLSEKPDACVDRFGSRGYTKKCRTRGDAKGWGEVWCIPVAPPVKPTAPLPAGQGYAWLVAVCLLAVAAVYFKLRRSS